MMRLLAYILIGCIKKYKAEIQRATQKYDDRDDEAGFGAADSDLDSR
jgi:hypothetical protein